MWERESCSRINSFCLCGMIVLHMESEWNLHDFLNASSKRLGVASLVRIFNSDGESIRRCRYYYG